eukprot:CAMPEP_0168753642 /NCGR_PEP_ID=MMETSP0724-20121128/19053_1 /TAXON_ID=265536 /ORGANISM="Amphiprora sp., Strain CCMP467" /LENGTH=578 /DNA_ID=CAMNT_0008802021 /DNA_START=100 /DNA_END=1836 /DNA_ORIENTATION=+
MDATTTTSDAADNEDEQVMASTSCSSTTAGQQRQDNSPNGPEKDEGDDDDDDDDEMALAQDNDNDQDMPLSSSSREPHHEEAAAPAQFHEMQKVYARDEDGLVYLAFIRRALYGRTTPRQCKIGYISVREAQELAKTEEEQRGYYDAGWHYYVHYDGWNVKWDRWVLEGNIYPAEDEKIKTYCERLAKEHKELRQSMMKKPTKGKKAFQTIDPSAFLQRWRRKVDQIDSEMRVPNPQLDVFRGDDFFANHGVGETQKRTTTGLKGGGGKKRKMAASLEQEKELRSRGLTKRRNPTIANKIVLPSALQKVLVDQWEIVCQCGMVAVIPAPITVRAALNKYLASKGVVSESELTHTTKETTPKPDEEHTQANTESKSSPNRLVVNSEGKTVGSIDLEPTEMAETTQTTTSGTMEETTNGDSAKRLHQELVDMTNGVARFFEDAIGNLLYKEEQAQFKEVSTNKEFKGMRYGDLYGTEHLLRLFVRLPEVLEAHLPLEETRPMLAKVNDLVRFLGKNQDSLFPLNHTRPRPPDPPKKKKKARKLASSQISESNGSAQEKTEESASSRKCESASSSQQKIDG